MTLSDLAHGEPWMDPEERQTAADLVQSLQQSFTDRQINETPFLVLRVQDYLLHHTLCRRLERSLTPDPAATPPVTVLPSLAEHIGKSRDRLRKALKELEDAATKLAPLPPPPPPPARPFNLPDFYKPILEEVGVDLINDPDFFADEDNFYDLPLEQQELHRPHRPDPDAAYWGTFGTETTFDDPEPAPPSPDAPSLESAVPPSPTAMAHGQWPTTSEAPPQPHVP